MCMIPTVTESKCYWFITHVCIFSLLLGKNICIFSPLQVNVTVLVIRKLNESQGKTRAGTDMRKVEYSVADLNALAELTVWKPKMVEEGQWYRITNVSAGQFWGRITLGTTPSSVIQCG